MPRRMTLAQYRARQRERLHPGFSARRAARKKRAADTATMIAYAEYLAAKYLWRFRPDLRGNATEEEEARAIGRLALVQAVRAAGARCVGRLPPAILARVNSRIMAQVYRVFVERVQPPTRALLPEDELIAPDAAPSPETEDMYRAVLASLSRSDRRLLLTFTARHPHRALLAYAKRRGLTANAARARRKKLLKRLRQRFSTP